MSDLLGYQDKHVVVTGCYSGIGRATAELLTSLGARVTGLDIKEPDYALPEFLAVDMGDQASVEAAAKAISDPVDGLFNCAGVSSGAGSTEFVVRIDVIGLRHLTELLVPQMPDGSAIVSVASQEGSPFRTNLALHRDFLATEAFDEAVAWWNAHETSFPRGGYSFSKQAIIVYSMIRGVQLAPEGIRVNCTGPGITDTAILQDSVKRYGADYVARVPRMLGRDATPQEQAWPLVFLNSPVASYVSGQYLWTDGGLAHAMELDLIDAGFLLGAPKDFREQ